MKFQVDYKAGKPVYLQLVDQVKRAAASGILKTGDALPSIRPLAEELRVNRNTVAKAYSELESQGILETHPGKGVFLREAAPRLNQESRDSLLIREIDPAVVAAHHLQVEENRFLKLVRQRYRDFEQDRTQGPTGGHPSPTQKEKP